MSKITVFTDASSLKRAACGRRLFWDVYEGYRESGINNDTHWGSAFHMFRAEWKKHRDEDVALGHAVKLWRSAGDKLNIKENKKYLTQAFLFEACEKYIKTYKHDDSNPVIDPEDGKPLLEPKSRFAFPFRVESDIEILVAGTMDDVSYHSSSSTWNGSSGYIVDDCKTSGTYKIWEHLNSYFLDPQLRVYRWAISKYAQYKPDSIWAKIHASPNVGCRIDGVYYGAGTNGETKLELRRSKIMVFKQWELDELEQDVNRICDTLIYDIRKFRDTGELPPRSGITVNACTSDKWGPCKYCNACNSVDDEMRDAALEQMFIKKEYNPLKFN